MRLTHPRDQGAGERLWSEGSLADALLGLETEECGTSRPLVSATRPWPSRRRHLSGGRRG